MAERADLVDARILDVESSSACQVPSRVVHLLSREGTPLTAVFAYN